MADKLELLLEAERRGILPNDKKPLLDEARKRGLIPASGDNIAPSAAPVTPPLYLPDGQGGEIGVQGAERAEYEQRAKEQGRQEQRAKAEGLANRGYGERALDTAAFIGSAPVRMATRGEYGLGDIVPEAMGGQAISNAERDFAQANEGFIEGAAIVGEVGAGIPGLNTMGAPLRGLGAALKAARLSPRGTIAGAIRGTGESLEAVSRDPAAIAGQGSALQAPAMVGRAGRSLQGYADNMQPPAPAKPSAASQAAGVPENIQTIPERLRDYEAFRELEMRPFGPAMGSQATARAARTIEEIPLVGGVVKSPKQTAELEARAAQEALARELGAPATEEAAGALVQRALERYRGAGVSDLEPGTLRNTPSLQTSPVGPKGPIKPQGINPYQPVKAAQTLTEGQRANITTAAPIRQAGKGGQAETSRGAMVPAAKPLDQLGLRRTNVEDLSKGELKRIVKAPSRDTSFATRAEALYESAWKKLPQAMRKDDSANSNQTGWKNLQNALRQTQREAANQISGQGTLGGDLAERIMRPRTHTNIAELRSITTEIGRALSNFGQFETRLDRTQLKRLYSAAIKDQEAGLTDLANRAWIRTQSTGKDKVSVQVAREADAALYEFRRATRYYRQGMARMDKFMNVLDAKTPNEAARKIITALKEKTANPGMLREIASTLRPEELKSFQGYVIQQLGTKRPGAKNAESIFNWNNWATDFNAIKDSPGGKEFLTKGFEPGVAKKLENLARVANRMKYYEATTNYSGSAYSGIGVLALADPTSAFATIGGGALFGKLLTSNAFLAWNEALMKAQLKAGNTAASNARIAAQYVKRLPALARANKSNPDLEHALRAFGLAMDEQLEGIEKDKGRLSPPSNAKSPARLQRQ
jgi:hypothetical protein